MKRRLLNLVTAVSLLMCVTVGALWGWSHRSRHSWKCVQRQVDYRVESCRGQVAWTEAYYSNVDRSFIQPPQYGVWRHWSDSPVPPLGERLKGVGPMPQDWFSLAGFLIGWSRTDMYINSGGPTRVVAVPYWAAFVFFGTVPALSTVRRTRSRRRLARQRHGLCPACGYDLTGNVSGVCPECGEATA